MIPLEDAGFVVADSEEDEPLDSVPKPQCVKPVTNDLQQTSPSNAVQGKRTAGQSCTAPYCIGFVP